MNNDRFYYISDLDINLPKISTDEQKLFESYIEMTRFFIELSELYKIFQANYSLLLENFTLNTNDTVYYRHTIIQEDELYTLINTFTINLISSGKSLSESIDTYLNTILGKETYNKFRSDISSPIYDKNFSYKLLLQLRNYSQHGHIPVEISKNKACFNLDDILNKPHIKIAKSAEESIILNREKILSNFGHNPYISYVYTIADFIYCTIKIYYEFLLFIKDDLKINYNKIKEKLLKRPELTNQEGIVYYNFDGNFFHAFNATDNVLSLFTEIKKIVREDLTKEETELKEIKKYLIKQDIQ
ncbi:TPA: hypothetical protein NR789_001888 [Enterococcus faecalis]|uniref:hypothetical protein n=1 Tax=Enterococcus TaxID=1350 RepID=UPI00132FC81E|nr:hypothetical protein [Enterococcus faecalis]HCJ0858982.1 hypothetical protein [Enterococcus faecalis]HCJ4774408.1 hypothetical protein [Enterococcus faecalis]